MFFAIERQVARKANARALVGKLVYRKAPNQFQLGLTADNAQRAGSPNV